MLDLTCVFTCVFMTIMSKIGLFGADTIGWALATHLNCKNTAQAVFKGTVTAMKWDS